MRFGYAESPKGATSFLESIAGVVDIPHIDLLPLFAGSPKLLQLVQYRNLWYRSVV